MDLGQYILGFLLKNRYCYLPGIGNIDIVKQDANAAERYAFRFTPIGTIEDDFAAYIANINNFSIAKAANLIRDYCQELKTHLQQGESYTIDQVGTLTLVNGRTQFQPVDNFRFDKIYQPGKMIQLQFKEAEHRDDEQKPKESYYVKTKPDRNTPLNTANLIRAGVLLGLVALLGIGGYVSYRFYKNYTENKQEQEQQALASDSTANAGSDILPKDTVPTRDALAATQPVSTGNFSVVLQQYNNLAAANKRYSQLKSFGNEVELTTTDSVQYSIVMNLPAASLADSVKVLDSLKRQFNPKGTVFIRR
jgi:hypothetical protein